MASRILAGRLLPLFDLQTLQEAPQHSVWVYAAVYRIAASLARVKPRIVERETEHEASGPSVDRVKAVLRRINDHQGWYGFAFAHMIHKKLDGESFIEKARNRAGETNRLFVLNPAGMRPIPGRDRLYARFEYDVAGDTIQFPVEDIIPIVNYNPRSPWRGMSPTAPVRREVSADINSLIFLSSLVKNMGRPGGILQPREGEFIGEEEFSALELEIRKQIQGVQNAGDLLVMPSGFEYKQEGFSLEEMKLLEARRFSRIAVAAAYGASPLMMNDSDAATYNNTENQQRAFWDHEGVPELIQLFEALNEFWIHPEIDDDIELIPDMRAIAAIIDSEESRSNRASRLFQGGQLTMNEARELVGKEPIDGGDVFAVPSNLQLVTREQLAAGELPSFGGSSAGGIGGFQAEAAKARRDADARAMREFHEHAIRQAERRVTRKMIGVFRQQAARIADRLRKVGKPSEEIIATVYDADQEALAIFRALVPTMSAVIEEASTGALVRMGAERRSGAIWTAKDDAPLVPELAGAFDLGNPRILDYLRRDFFEKIKDITEETRRAVAKAVADGLAAGEAANQIALRIEDSTAFSEFRSNRVARTETNGAFNLGTSEAFRAAGTPRRSWLTAGWGDIRDSHRELESRTQQEPIALDALFEMRDARGVVGLRWPADTQAPGWASVHCRCSQVPEQDEQRAYYAARCREALWTRN
ncbi:MAG: phage portal protein [Dehalococcoidia bacterium]